MRFEYGIKGKIFIIVFLLCLLLPFSFLSILSSASDEPYIIAFDPTLPPYQFIENNQYKGFFISLINEISANTNQEIHLLQMPLSDAVEAIKFNEIDGILGIRYDSELEQNLGLLFSESLVNSTISIVAREKSFDAIQSRFGNANVLIAVEQNSIEFEYVKNVKKANFNLTYNQENVMDLLLMGRAEIAIGVRHVAEYMLENTPGGNAYTLSNSYETPVDFYLSMSSAHESFINLFNSELHSLKLNGTYEDFYNEWINDKLIENQKRIESNLTVMAIAIVVIICIVIIIARINIQLTNTVEEKTKELRETNQELENKIYEIKSTVALKDLMFESSPRSIIVFDSNQTISAMNSQALVLCKLGATPVGMSIHLVQPIAVMLAEYIDDILIKGMKFMALEYHQMEGDTTRYYRYHIYPLNAYENHNRGGIITIEDTTDEHIYKSQALERAKSKALSRLISGIAHEIRNPLTSIKTYAELVPIKMENTEFQKQIATVIPNEVIRVNQLIENLIDYTKPKVKSIERLNLQDLVDSCLLLLQPSLTKSNIEVVKTFNDSIQLNADKNQLTQVLINILLNANDAIEEYNLWAIENAQNNFKNMGHQIGITIDRHNSKSLITFSDTGIGMTADELQHVFELFYTTKTKGSGIGLPLSKQLVEENDGTIFITSEKYKGTTITLTFEEGTYATT